MVLSTALITFFIFHPHEQTRYKIGVLLPQSGLLGQIGLDEKNAFELAFDHLQQSNTKKFDIVFEDSQSDIQATTAAAKKLIVMDHVDLLIASTTGAYRAAQPIARQAHLPQVAFCMSSEVARSSPSTVRFHIGIEEEAKAIIEFVKKGSSNQKVAILHPSDELWTTAVKDIYRPGLDSFLASPIIDEQYAMDKNLGENLQALINKLQQTRVQVVVLLGYGFEYGSLFAHFQKTDFAKQVTFIGGWGLLHAPVPEDELEGVYVAGPMYMCEKNSFGEAFDKAFLAKYGHQASLDSAFTYELATRIPEILEIIRKEGVSSFKEDLYKQDKREGVFGKYSFDQNGNMIVETVIGQYRSGAIVRD